MLFVSLIKEALKEADPNYYDKLYFYGERANKKSKNFCFSVFVSNFEEKNGILYVKDKIILNISTPDYECGINIYNGLLKTKNFQYKEYNLEREKIFPVREKRIDGNEAVFKTLSPIVIKDKDNNFLSPEDEMFGRELNYISNTVLRNYRGYGLVEPLEFQSVLMKKKIVKEEIEDFIKVTGRRTYYVNAYAGVFKLKGAKEDLEDLYQLGIGFRRSQGFGMIEVV
jgi:CRISPR-associated endoribonuclease Cas6